MGRLGVPAALWETVLLCQAFTIPGWSAWAKHQVEMAERGGEESADLTGLLALRLAYDVALGEHAAFSVNWRSVTDEELPPGAVSPAFRARGGPRRGQGPLPGNRFLAAMGNTDSFPWTRGGRIGNSTLVQAEFGTEGEREQLG